MYDANPGLGGECNLAVGQSLCLPIGSKPTNTAATLYPSSTSSSTSAPSSTPTSDYNTDCTAKYTVEAGDTCTDIVQKSLHSFISLSDLSKWNGGDLSFCESISVGDEICVGPEEPYCDSEQYYEVQPGDGCWAIANSDGGATSKV